MNRNLLFAFLLLFAVKGISQNENPKNLFKYSLNLKYNLQKDEVFSRVGRQTLAYGLDLGYGRFFKEKIYLGFDIEANLGTMRTFTKTNNTGTNYLVSLGLVNRYKINSSLEKFSFWLGAKAIFDANILFPAKELRYGWDVSLGLHPSFFMDYKLNEKITLSYETDFSLLAILWRPNAQGFTLDSEILLETKGIGAVLFEEKTFASLHNMFKWNNAIRMEYAFKPKTSLQVVYDMHLTSISVPRNKISLSNGIKLGIIHKF